MVVCVYLTHGCWSYSKGMSSDKLVKFLISRFVFRQILKDVVKGKILILLLVLTKISSACSCWLTTEHGFIWAFAGPVVCVLIVNTVMFVKALVIAHRSLARKQPEKNTGNTLTLLKGLSYTTTQFDQRNYN